MEDKTNKPGLALSDIRGEQEFIYKCNCLKEIVGGSAIIRALIYRYFSFLNGENTLFRKESI